MLNFLAMSNPAFMVAAAGLSIYGSMQAGKAEKARQRQIAAQQEQNAKFEELSALQAHNERQDRLASLIGVNETIRAKGNRGSNDRSIAALTASEKKKSSTQDNRARTQTMLSVSRSRFAAADARAQGNQAMRTALFKSVGTAVSLGDKMSEI